MQKILKCKIIIPVVLLLIFSVTLIMYCVQTKNTDQPEQRIYAEDIEKITIIDRKWPAAKLIERSEDIKEVCDILNTIEILEQDVNEEMMLGGAWFTFVITFTSGEEKIFDYYAGTSLEYGGETYYIEDGRLELLWTSAHYDFKEGTYNPKDGSVQFD